RSVIRRFLPSPRLPVYHDRFAARRERLCKPDVIDPQTQIASECARAVVPPAKLLVALIVHPECVDKSPVSDARERFLLRLAEQNSASPQVRVVHVPVLGRYVEVSAHQHRFLCVIELVKEFSKTLQPPELELILVSTDRLAVWNIDVDDLDARGGRGDQSRLRPFFIVGQTASDVDEICF